MAALVSNTYITARQWTGTYGSLTVHNCKLTKGESKWTPNRQTGGGGGLGTPRPDLTEACLLKQHHCWTLTLLKSLSLYTVCLPPGLQLPGRQWRGEGGCVECVGETRHPPTLHCVCGNPRQPHWFALQIVHFRNSYPLVGPFHTRNFHTRKKWSCFIS